MSRTRRFRILAAAAMLVAAAGWAMADQAIASILALIAAGLFAFSAREA